MSIIVMYCQQLDFTSSGLRELLTAWGKSLQKLLYLPETTHGDLFPVVTIYLCQANYAEVYEVLT